MGKEGRSCRLPQFCHPWLLDLSLFFCRIQSFQLIHVSIQCSIITKDHLRIWQDQGGSALLILLVHIACQLVGKLSYLIAYVDKSHIKDWSDMELVHKVQATQSLHNSEWHQVVWVAYVNALVAFWGSKCQEFPKHAII